MGPPLTKWLIIYGVVVLVIAILAVMYRPAAGEIGFNPTAKSALIAGGICGGLAIFWGILLSQGISWARIAAIVTVVVFAAAFTCRGILAWRAFAGGQNEKWYAAAMISATWIASIVLLIRLLSSAARAQSLEA
jgi:hypothetical protein